MHLTQVQVATLLDTYAVSVSRIECGHSCSPEMLARYAGLLEMGWLDFLKSDPLSEKNIAT